MPLLERIKKSIFGEDTAAAAAPGDRERDDDYELASARHPNVSTPADDPIMDDVAASGVQPVSKPAPIEEAQNPERKPVALDD